MTDSLAFPYFINIDNMIGRGSFADVFTGRHMVSGHIVAIKRVFTGKKSLRTMLNAELSVLKKIQHTNIVKLLDLSEEQNVTYLALEYCDGGTLAECLEGKPMHFDLVQRIVDDITPAITYLHNINIWHRDIKPANILRHCNVFKLTDFGMAKEDSDMATTVCGSPIYMAPELINRSGYSELADVWSYGVVLYQCITGRLPYPAKSIDELKYLHRKSEIRLTSTDPISHAVNMMLTRISRPPIKEIWQYLCNRPSAMAPASSTAPASLTAPATSTVPASSTAPATSTVPASLTVPASSTAPARMPMFESGVIVDRDSVTLDIQEYQPRPSRWQMFFQPGMLPVDSELQKHIWSLVDDVRLVMRVKSMHSPLQQINLHMFSLDLLREAIRYIRAATQPHLLSGRPIPDDFQRLIMTVKKLFSLTLSNIYYSTGLAQNSDEPNIDTAESLIYEYAHRMAIEGYTQQTIQSTVHAIKSYRESLNAFRILLRVANNNNDYFCLHKIYQLVNDKLSQCIHLELDDAMA
jgi:serine/threonine protein kinase